MSGYWQGVEAGLARISEEKPQTFAEVKAILDTLPGGDTDNACDRAGAFFGGSGGDLSLGEALRDAGWRGVWSEASYYWCKRSTTGGLLTYVEGDVYEGNTMQGVIDDE